MRKSKREQKCIIHLEVRLSNTIEHIVSESLGNKKYLLERGCLCDDCNNSFSNFERKALGESVLAMERIRHAIPTKKKKPAKVNMKELKIEGDSEYRKNYVSLKEVKRSNIRNFNSETGVFELVVPGFPDSSAATSKLLLKTGIEAIYQSRKKLYHMLDFNELRKYLLNKNNADWPFITSNAELGNFSWIPKGQENQHLLKKKCSLRYVIDDGDCIFKFKYGGISMLINLSNRSKEWIADYADADDKAMIYPKHYRKKVAAIA